MFAKIYNIQLFYKITEPFLQMKLNVFVPLFKVYVWQPHMFKWVLLDLAVLLP